MRDFNQVCWNGGELVLRTEKSKDAGFSGLKGPGVPKELFLFHTPGDQELEHAP